MDKGASEKSIVVQVELSALGKALQYINLTGLKPQDKNMWTYIKSFITHDT